MNPGLASLVLESGPILTEGAVVERLRHEHRLPMDPQVNHAGLIYDEEGRRALSAVYGEYRDLAFKHGLPILLMTPTRRVNIRSVAASTFRGRDIIGDAVGFLDGLRGGSAGEGPPVLLGGLLGCAGDAYDARTALGTREALDFHRNQVRRFDRPAVDFLFAGIMPAVTEAAGMALAMAESGKPYIISFMLRRDGRLLDGTGLAEAIRGIDAAVSPRPLGYMANCIHPHNLRLGLESPVNRASGGLARMLGLQANASLRSPEELDRSPALDKGDFGFMIREMAALRAAFGFKILGGCCGTDGVFIDRLAAALAPGAR